MRPPSSVGAGQILSVLLRQERIEHLEEGSSVVGPELLDLAELAPEAEVPDGLVLLSPLDPEELTSGGALA